MSDLIDRHALLKQIDIDSDGEPGYYGDTWKFIDTIKNMPNVHDLPKDTDTISRQTAQRLFGKALTYKEQIGKLTWTTSEVKQWLADCIEQLPPAQLSTNLAEVGTDCISRQAAIGALRAMQTYKLFAGDDMLLIDQAGAQTELMLLPPAQPERIRGRWTMDNACSECGCQPWFSGDIHNYNFCPNCGADMREVTE